MLVSVMLATVLLALFYVSKFPQTSLAAKKD
jgi:hypothetical protein